MWRLDSDMGKMCLLDQKKGIGPLVCGDIDLVSMSPNDRRARVSGSTERKTLI